MNAYSPNAGQADLYLKSRIETASPEELLIMLYDGAIRFLLLAKKAHAENRLEKRHKNLLKAQNIIREFMASLDVDSGGEVAQNLLRLYEYLHYRLVQANIKQETEPVDEVLQHLRELKSTWEEAIRIARRERNAATDGSVTVISA